jgi:toxin ParE1/3/4
MDIEWTNRALADLDSIHEFIAKDDRSAAVDTIDLIIATVETHLPRQPDMGRPGRVDGTRETRCTALPIYCSVPGTPFTH